VEAKIETLTYENINYALTVNYDVVTTVTTRVVDTSTDPTDPTDPEDPADECNDTNFDLADSGFDLFQDKYVRFCNGEPNKSPSDSECREPKTCSAMSDEQCYKDHCIENGEDICEKRAKGETDRNGPCPNRSGIVGGGELCDVGDKVSPKAEFKATHARRTFTTAGCLTRTIGSNDLPGGLPGGGINPVVPKLGGRLKDFIPLPIFDLEPTIEQGIPQPSSNNGNPAANNRRQSYRYTWTTAVRIVSMGHNFD
jgi:hypothetical protein